MNTPAPSPGPAWAERSIVEDGTVVHEYVCKTQPLVVDRCSDGLVVQHRPTQVSVSVTDSLIHGRWIRGEPTVQLEGGSYSMDALVDLSAAIDEAAGILRTTPRKIRP